MMRPEFAIGKMWILILKSEFIICMWLGSSPIKISLRALAKTDISGFKMSGIPISVGSAHWKEH